MTRYLGVQPLGHCWKIKVNVRTPKRIIGIKVEPSSILEKNNMASMLGLESQTTRHFAEMRDEKGIHRVAALVNFGSSAPRLPISVNRSQGITRNIVTEHLPAPRSILYLPFLALLELQPEGNTSKTHSKNQDETYVALQTSNIMNEGAVGARVLNSSKN
jgi:hypothetical protein